MWRDMKQEQLFRKRTSTGIEATHQSVEEIISDIKNPDLDCSLEDIQVHKLLTFSILKAYAPQLTQSVPTLIKPKVYL